MPCEHDTLPLARIGTVQLHGVMLVIGPNADGRVEHVSENVGDILGVAVEDLLGARPTLAFPDAESAARLEEILRPGRVYFDNPAPLLANGRKFEAASYVRDGRLIIEIEPYIEAEHDYLDMVGTALDALAKQSAVAGLYAASVTLMEYVTGWDRVMLYKFASHGHGNVVAEQHAPYSGLPGSFLNYYFSASDVPESAKEILRSGKARQKPQQDASVPLLTRGPSGGVVASVDAVDMTDCWLRGIHPCDNGYNRNLGVSSNIIFPVNVDSKIWGLFVVHNKTTRFLNYESRVVIEQLTMMFSSRLIELEALEARMQEREHAANGMLQALASGADLMERIDDAEDEFGLPARVQVARTLSQHLAGLTLKTSPASRFDSATRDDAGGRFGKDLMRLADADGVAVLRTGHAPSVHVVGATPDALTLRGIASLFGSVLPAFEGAYRIFATDALGDLLSLIDEVRACAIGLLAAPLSERGDCIMWFRKERVIDATWAGRSPSNADLNSTKMLQAREDFSATRRPLTGAARPWLEAEVYLACNFAASVADFWSRQGITPRSEQTGRVREPALAAALQSVDQG